MAPPSRKPLKTLLSPFQQFAKIEASGGILLIACTAVALLWANLSKESYDALWHLPVQVGFGDFLVHKDLLHWINDGLMAIFFFVVGLEIKREIRVGELGSPKQAILPIVAAIGGMAIPAALYLALNSTGDAHAGWGIPMATDIAFALGILTLVKSERVPVTLKVFLTAVAIVDDLGAVMVIALFYTEKLSITALIWAAIFFAVLFVANRLRIRSISVYAILGFFLWLAFLKSGIHATVAGILAASMIPLKTLTNTENFVNCASEYLQNFKESRAPEERVLLTKGQQIYISALEDEAEKVQSPLQRLEHNLHPWVIYVIMPVFALANAGVLLDARIFREVTEPVFLGVFLGLFLGKQVGVLGAAWLAVKARLTMLPPGVTWRHLYGAACLAGVGFTMSLFIAGLAMKDPTLLREAKMGILAASLASAVVGWLVLRQAPTVRDLTREDSTHEKLENKP